MKNAILYFALISLCFLITADEIFAQAPPRISYQAVVRDAGGHVIDNATVGIRVSILQGSQEGTAVYIERHNTSTNANGLVSIQIGAGTDASGTLQGIDWSQGPYFIKSETDPQGGTGYSITGVSEMLSVPYALFAANGGVPGPQGPQGPQGPAGPEGPQGITGETGNGIDEVTDNGSGQLTFHFDDGSTYTTPDLTGPEGPPGDQDLSGLVRAADLPTAVPAHEADPTFTSSVAADITATQVTQWDAAHAWGDHALEGYLKSERQGLGDVLALGTDGGNAPLTNVSKISVGGEGTEPSAIVELTSTDKGFLPPRMGDAFRDAIVNPAEGLIIFNTNVGRPQFFDGVAWHNLDGTVNAPVGNAYYVSVNNPNATDGTGGTKTTPFRSISQAIARASTNPSIRNIIVAKGTYNETISVPQGVNIYGGYEDFYWVRFEEDNAGTIVRGVSGPAGHAATIIAQSVTQATTINGLTIVGQNAQTAGRNSYAIYVNNSPGLILSDNFIIAGNGANGVTGFAGTDGVNGVNGMNGAGAFETTGTGECDASNNRPGGAGGVLSVAGRDISGGQGGGNHCSPVAGSQGSSESGVSGRPGTSTGSGGVSGSGGFDASFMSTQSCQISAQSMHGGDGGDGSDGAFGSGGAGATDNNGLVLSSHWVGVSGLTGQPGGSGGGGGGGGSGGGADCVSGCTHARLGGAGGGGGSGGGGGAGGSAGGAGGSSFGIFIVNGGKPMITDNEILLGSGGSGGSGGFGGTGGTGGSGGAGGAALFCAEAGGAGGNGGDGGHGGGAGGGAGGNAYGIFTHNVTGSQDYLSPDSNNTFFGGQAGQGGTGGKSLGNEGTNGVNGRVEHVR